jgi:catechol 2,3-dioxygenase-like lactoylglutathione lyase family enzyme
MNKFKYAHVAITVKNINETKRFYKAIGFKVVDERIAPEKKRHFLLLEGYNFQIEVFHFDNQRDRFAQNENYTRVGFLHFALPCVDLKTMKKNLLKQKLHLATDLRVTSLGVYNFTLIDPSGISIEFFQI